MLTRANYGPHNGQCIKHSLESRALINIASTPTPIYLEISAKNTAGK